MLGLQISSSVFWSDSSTVIAWVNSNKSSFHVFVANRLSEIWENSKVDKWSHVPGILNHADLGTRWMETNDHSADHSWFTGPEFPYRPESLCHRSYRSQRMRKLRYGPEQ